MKPKRRRSDQRVAVFVDGWNLHRGCERAFGFGQVHPLLLGRELAGERKLEAVRYFIGVPDSRVEADNAQRRNRQLDFMEKTGVAVMRKKLRYRWEWRFDKYDLPDPRDREGETRDVEVTARQQGREKGVDTWLVIDAFRWASRVEIDTVIVVSADSDMDLVATQVRDAGVARVENAVVNRHGRKIINKSFQWTHQIDKPMFGKVRDDTDYSRKLSPSKRDALLASLRVG